GKPCLPVLRKLSGLLGNGIDVIGGSQGDHIRLEAINDCTRLLAGAAVRLIDLYVLARLLLPMLDEFGIKSLVEFAGGIIGNIEQRLLCRARAVHAGRHTCCDRQRHYMPAREFNLHRTILCCSAPNDEGPTTAGLTMCRKEPNQEE